jgi:hypothetical protein
MGLGNLINLYRIQKLYSHYRKGVDKPTLFKTKEYWLEFFKLAWSITEVKEIMGWLTGYKTYIIAALTAALTLAHSLGYIDEASFQTLLALLGAGGISTVAAKINRMQNDIDNKVNVTK